MISQLIWIYTGLREHKIPVQKDKGYSKHQTRAYYGHTVQSLYNTMFGVNKNEIQLKKIDMIMSEYQNRLIPGQIVIFNEAATKNSSR